MTKPHPQRASRLDVAALTLAALALIGGAGNAGPGVLVVAGVAAVLAVVRIVRATRGGFHAGPAAVALILAALPVVLPSVFWPLA